MGNNSNNFLNPEFQQNYAAKHTAEILKTLSQQWRDEYLTLLRNEPLYSLVQAEHPLVLEVYEGRFQAARIAQRLAVVPAPPPAASKPQPRLTPEEWQSRIERYRQRQLDRLRVQAEDEIAKKLQKFELAQELRDRAQNMNLDEDEIERLVQELLGDLDQDEEEDGRSFKQL